MFWKSSVVFGMDATYARQPTTTKMPLSLKRKKPPQNKQTNNNDEKMSNRCIKQKYARHNLLIPAMMWTRM